MLQPIRAVYHAGQLRLLDPVDLSEGEEIQLMILSESDRVLAVLGDLLVKVPDSSSENVDEAALAQEIEQGFQGQSPLSETILQERLEGP